MALEMNLEHGRLSLTGGIVCRHYSELTRPSRPFLTRCSMSPLETPVNDCEAENTELERILICRKYLLDAGSDPTMTYLDHSNLPPGSCMTSTFEFAVPVRRPVSDSQCQSNHPRLGGYEIDVR